MFSLHVLVACHCATDDLLGGFPTASEEIAAILFVLSSNEFRLEHAAAELPLAATLAQARLSGIRLNEDQQRLLKDLQDNIAEGLSWEETIATCSSILNQTGK